eukprot:TRINITY_DN4836_c0_g2_i3.p1 TRINITY_DN4836_c0_g2~~TRINITY_DN4836_c0_g2_i3.p1  ORF type:complete len:410 (+),score=111.57 TRINITY_DN4836_c0_g2_i3:133-1362(+)
MCIRDRYQRRVRGPSNCKMSSPRSQDGAASPRTPSALRNELAAAKRAVEVLKAEKQNSDDKLDKLHAVLEKERNALRDVLSAARVKVDELEKVKKAQADEIERLKALLAQQQGQTSVPDMSGEVSRLKAQITQFESDLNSSKQTVSQRDRTIVDLRNQLQSGSGHETDLQKQLTDLQRQLAEARAGAGMKGDAGEVGRLQKRIEDLTQSLQSTQKTMREQVEAARGREQDMREQMTTQRQQMQERIRELEAALRVATDSSKAHVLEKLQRDVLRYRQHAALRIFNAMLRMHHSTMSACMFHQWVVITQCSLLSKSLLADAEYQLNRLRNELTPGLGGPFGHTPLLHVTHLATRSLGTPQRYDKWELMSPRSGTGDGGCALSPRSGKSPRSARHTLVSPATRSLANDVEF